jgi:hypothetical protein
MQMPPIVYRGRDLIEGLVPRDGAIQAVVHIGVGLAGAGAAVAVATHMPDANPTDHRAKSGLNFLRKATMGLAVGTAPLFLTAGMMLNTPGGQALNRGITPNYFLAAGAVLGAAFITYPIANALQN